jgi:hypothetical protein
VNHKRREWARDDDGDGVREVHSNRIEGFWLGLRNYLRPFRGVSKWCLDIYLAFYQGMHNHRRDALGFLRKLLRPRHLGGNMSQHSNAVRRSCFPEF